MKSIALRSTIRVVVAIGLTLVASAAFCAAGFTIEKNQEMKITLGMSRAEVRNMLGRPAHNVKYMAEPGRSWTYGVVGDSVIGNGVGEQTVFDVDFSADGKVISFAERKEMTPK